MKTEILWALQRMGVYRFVEKVLECSQVQKERD